MTGPWSRTTWVPVAIPGIAEDTEAFDRQVEFVDQLRNGDEQAFESLVSEYERPITRFLYRYLGNTEEAREVCQDVFLKIFRGISSFQNQCSLRTWIFRITLNTVLNERRKWYHRLRDRFLGLEEITRTYRDTVPDPELSLTMNDRTRKIMLALRKMREDHRAILVLRDLEGLSYQEIATALDLALGTVKSRLARARQEMKDAIQEVI
jgi:RNA polymerase sigma-70 factor (ECF subfamily)